MSELDRQHNDDATEAPTPRRREQARAQGQFIESTELTTSVHLLAGWGALTWFGAMVAQTLAEALLGIRNTILTLEWSIARTQSAATTLAWDLLRATAPLLTTIIVFNLFLQFLKRGSTLTIQPIRWNWARLLPQQGAQKLFSKEVALRGLWALLKLIGTLLLGGYCLWQCRHQVATADATTTLALTDLTWKLCLQLFLVLSAASLVIGLSDLFMQWRRHEQRLMMTHDEITRELKEEQGDPHLKSFLKRRQRELLKQRSLKEVPKASLIITNPTHVAVAIQYRLGSTGAPKVLAKGTDELAQRIKDIARQHQIHMVENKPLARALYQTAEIGQEIPPEFYKAIAEILARLYQQRPL